MHPVKLGAVADLQTSLRHVVQLRSKESKELLSVVIFRFDTPPDATIENAAPQHQTWYSMQSECPHLSFPLEAASEFADGKLTASTVVLAPCSITQEGTIEIEDSDLFVVCPYHSFDFSLTTGQCGHAGSGSKLEACVWPVRVEGPDLWIEMDQEYELFSLRAVNPNFAATAPSPVSASALPQEDLPESATVTDWIHRIMSEPNGKQKVALTRTLVQRFRSGQCTKIGKTAPPDVPARESSLKSVDPSQVSKRGKGGSERSRIAILHALANIELYAIDLALDVLARFPTYHGKAMPLSYFMDFLKVAEDEAKHYTLLCERLEALGSYFGALPVHSGLWTSAQQTKDDLLERISIVNLVHESRGLDTNPGQIQKFKNAGDKGSEEVLTTIHHDEVTHVATGHRWLMYLCSERQETPLDPVQVFRAAVSRHFVGSLKPPFNGPDRAKAGLTPDYYENMHGNPISRDFKKPLRTAVGGG